MDVKEYRDPVYLHRYYAGQALIGLLADGFLENYLNAANELEPKGATQIAKVSFAIADSMAEEAAQHAQH